MEYILQGYTVKGLTLDDVKQEVRIQTDILVGIVDADPRFQTNNSNIEFVIKGFNGYDELAALIKEACNNWVKDNYPNT